jgi:ribonuclease P protein component
VFTHAKRFQGDGFVVLCAPAPLLQIAVVVSKKVAKSAVARNRVRRVLRAVCERTARHAKSGEKAVIVLVHPTTGGMTERVLRERAHSLEQLCLAIFSR